MGAQQVPRLRVPTAVAGLLMACTALMSLLISLLLPVSSLACQAAHNA